MKSIIKWAFDSENDNGAKIVFIGILIFLIFSTSAAYLAENEMIPNISYLILFYLANTGWIVGVIGAIILLGGFYFIVNNINLLQ